MSKTGITLVSYHNTLPFLKGLQAHKVSGMLDIQLDIPSVGASKLIDRSLALGLVPVAALKQLPTAALFSDWCIGADGPVETVCLYGHVPVEEMQEIVLDYHSRTSVQLCRLLCREYWKISPAFRDAKLGFRDRLSEGVHHCGAVVIGDRAIGLEGQFEYRYDLAEVWKAHTGLPFVFAAWVSTAKQKEGMLAMINEALGQGVEMIPQIVHNHRDQRFAGNFSLERYLTRSISYNLDEAKKEALALFLDKIGHQIPAII